MNILKSSYSELHSIVRYIPNIDSNEKELFHGIYLTKKMTKTQEIHWKEILERKHFINDNSTFLYNLLMNCYRKNRLNILLMNIDMKNTILSKHTFQYDDYVKKNSLISHICLSNLWARRRKFITDDALIYLLSEFVIIESLNRKRLLFTQLCGTQETFFSVPYYVTRTAEEKKRNDLRVHKFNTRKRTVQFHLHATKQGQQANLTDLCLMLIDRNMIQYHVSKYERFDINHPIEKSLSGQMFIDAWLKSDFSKTFFSHRPKQELEYICEHLMSIFEKFQSNHHRFYLRRRSRLPFSYANHHVPEPTATLDQLVPLTTPISSVQNFVSVWLKKVLPRELFGSAYNHKLFIHKMRFLIDLPRTQDYSLGDAIRKIKFKHFHWAKTSINSSSLISHLYICHLIHFLVRYVLVLIRSYFYVTEASSPCHQLALVFYRHKIWYVIQRQSRIELFHKSCSSHVEKDLTDNYDCIRYLWKIRFVPKVANVRYLACAQTQFNTKENISHLKYTSEVLKYLRRHNSHLMGISTFNRIEMHRRWQDYCRNAPPLDNDNMTYFLRSDVSNFYDSINLDYLDLALVEFLDNCQFTYDLYIHTLYKTQYRKGRFIRRKITYWVGKENEQLLEIMTDSTKRVSNGTFHDMIIYDAHVEIYNKEKLLKYIRAQLFNSHLYTLHPKKLPIKTFRRIIGINHGLRIASMLGQIYLNKIDYDISFNILSDEFAVRHEDDLLIISPHRYRLQHIKQNMTKKLDELHHITNSLKTKTNIRHKTMKKFRPVEYWGSLVDIQSREILVTINQNDNSENKVTPLTIKITREIGYHLRHSLINALFLRSHSYYFDRLYTSDKTLIRNFYFLSCYFFKRLHSMCFRFAQFYSHKYIQSKSLFLFRTIRSGLRMLIKKTFNYDKKSIKLVNQCKYVFFSACIQLVKQNKHLFNYEMIIKRCSHMIRKLKYLNKQRKCDIKKNLLDLNNPFKN
ncbi:unnamed protein product [Rotaria magnacalcarata]|uniref:Telomerase reverse transcriptase n=5 Tax=Rotaria magnacalcarata TaxID=392030 RepID=A0A815PXD3_9BILA|nr:unnamed protein product [Rotaria magnacalcarata]CAF3859238.1 unnamed protein product [Rotaria magnacalcarata]